jgi:glycosyltransferase involved in cell wall biosynthesis
MIDYNNKKITIFVPSLGIGGAERVVNNLVIGFDKNNIKVDLLLAKEYDISREHIPNGVNIIDFKHSRTMFSLFSLIKYLKRNKGSIVLSHLRHANRIAILANILSGRKSKVFVVEHTTRSIVKDNVISDTLNMILYNYLYPKAEKIIHVSKEAAEDLENKYNWRRGTVKVLYNPVVNEEKVHHYNLPHEWFVVNKPPVILGVGRLIPDKNFSLLINAFYHVRQKLECRLIILGQGEEADVLRKLIYRLNLQNDVHMPGYVNNPYDYMSHASVFVLSSIREGLPTVLIEALACGCPVVSTRCPSGPTEILENGKYGELVSVGDAQAMADAIIRTIKKPPGKELLIDRARYFSIDRSVSRYIKLLGLTTNHVENNKNSVL